MTPILAAITLVAVGWLLVAERRGSQPGIWTWKPLASTAFVATAVSLGAIGHLYGKLVLAALCLCWLGDVLLIPQDERIFRLGILSFLAGHLGFVAAFVARGVSPLEGVVALALVAVPAAFVLRWLMPHLSSDFRIPVTIYVSVISVMVAAAVATNAASRCVWLLAGALAFAVSDLSVARDRFVKYEFTNRAWGLPLYYAAVLLLAVSARP